MWALARYEAAKSSQFLASNEMNDFNRTAAGPPDRTTNEQQTMTIKAHAHRKPPHSISSLIVVSLISLPIPAMAGQVLATRGYVFTANENGNSVSRVSLASGKIDTQLLPIEPHNVQITPDGTKLLVVGSPVASDSEEHGGGQHDQVSMPMNGGGIDMSMPTDAGGELLVLDPRDLTAPPLEIAVGNHPAHVVTDSEGRRAFVTNAEDDTISVVDVAAGRLTGTIPTGDYPHGLRLSPDGLQLLVANVQDGSVSLFDLRKLTETARIPVGKAPVQVAFLPDGSRAYVSLRDEDAVAVLDLVTKSVIGRISVGNGPIQLFATPDSRKVFVANQGTAIAPDNTVSVIDVTSGSVVATLKGDTGPHGVAMSTDGALAFITNVNAGTLSVVDTQKQTIVKSYPVGAGPNGVTYLND